MKKILIITLLLMSGGLLFAGLPDTFTPTVTMTVTETVTPTLTETPMDTMTSTITATITETPTNPDTFTVTPTFTITPTPQSKAFAFPNPAKNTTWVGFAYPMDNDSKGNPVQMVTII